MKIKQGIFGLILILLMVSAVYADDSSSTYYQFYEQFQQFIEHEWSPVSMLPHWSMSQT